MKRFMILGLFSLMSFAYAEESKPLIDVKKAASTAEKNLGEAGSQIGSELKRISKNVEKNLGLADESCSDKKNSKAEGCSVGKKK